MSNQETTLPAVGSADNTGTERIYRTALSQRDYISLELEAMSRGLKPFGLTKSVMTLYLHKKLLLVSELPKELQAQIVAHYQAKQTARQ
jgi:hypothetical protein